MTVKGMRSFWNNKKNLLVLFTQYIVEVSECVLNIYEENFKVMNELTSF